jgi:transposase
MARAPQKNGAPAIRRSRGGLSTPDGYRRAEAHDVTQAEPLLDGVQVEKVVTDRADDWRKLFDAIHAHRSEAVIPARSNNQYPREFDPHVDKARSLLERFFNRIKYFCRVATRYDKLDRRYQAFVAAASILIWVA